MKKTRVRYTITIQGEYDMDPVHYPGAKTFLDMVAIDKESFDMDPEYTTVLTLNISHKPICSLEIEQAQEHVGKQAAQAGGET